MNEELVVDLFAGPGGWDQGLRAAGFTGRIVGIEHDWSACKTAMGAGHQRVQADVATFPLGQLIGRVTGVLGSPPCTTFSGAGHGAGRLVTELLITAMTNTARGMKVLAKLRRDITAALREEALRKYPKGTRVQRSAWCRKQATITALVLQPLRYVLAVRPRWVALEQVREVAPLWRHLAMLLRELGYNTWSGVLSAERFGVPQTRVRAVLVAHRDGPASAPEPTHLAYRKDLNYDTAGDLFGEPLPPPLSMADALGWALDTTVEFQRGKGMAERHGERPRRPAPAPAPTIRAGSGGVGTNLLVHQPTWVLRHGPESNATKRAADEPAATVFSQRSGNLTREQARPATTVCGDARIAPPGHRDREGGERQFTQQTRKVTVQEAAILQSFPPDYPWNGTKSKQYEQVGNAVPPLLAKAVLRQFVSTESIREAA